MILFYVTSNYANAFETYYIRTEKSVLATGTFKWSLMSMLLNRVSL